jgi:hypothetical protein
MFKRQKSPSDFEFPGAFLVPGAPGWVVGKPLLSLIIAD